MSLTSGHTRAGGAATNTVASVVGPSAYLIRRSRVRVLADGRTGANAPATPGLALRCRDDTIIAARRHRGRRPADRPALERGRPRQGRRGARARHGRALAALRPARPGAVRGRDRPAGRRPARTRPDRGHGRCPARRARPGRLGRTGRRLRAGRTQHPQGATGDPDRGARAQHGLLGGAAVPAGALGRGGRGRAVRHCRAGAGAGRRRPGPGAGPDRVQRAVRAAHRLRVAQPRPGRGGPVRGRADVRFRAGPGRGARHGRGGAAAARRLRRCAPGCRSTCWSAPTIR